MPLNTLAKKTQYRRGALALVAALGLSACGVSGGDIGKSFLGAGNAGKSVSDISPDAFVAPPWCPTIRVENGRYLLMKFQKGKEDDARALDYQASIEKWATGCKRVDGQTQLTIGVSGRLTPGPAWPGGEVLLPVRVVLENPDASDEKAKAEEMVFTVPITLGAGAPAELWSLVDSSILISSDARPKVAVALDEGAKGKRR